MFDPIHLPGKPGALFMAIALSTLVTTPANAEDAKPVKLDEVSVTATRSERGTKEVPTSITVIGSERIESEKMFNIKDALQGTPGVQINSKNGGFDSRLVIRGAGQKATYGVREIMVLRDGVPMTDPDSFTRFDFIDTQDIERIEVTKGPGSIYGGGSAGGVIQILSKSVFETDENRVRIGAGTSGTTNAHARVGSMIGDNDALAITVSRRAIKNQWRRWNEFESTQASLKHGHIFEDGGTWETELSFANVNMQLPGSLSETQFEDFKDTGKQLDNYNAWKYSGRDSNSYFFNSKYEFEDGDITYKPRLYANKWDHYHPVTGAINVSPDNYVVGGDGEINWKHDLLGESMLVVGLSARVDKSIDAKKYQYRDYTTCCAGRISEVTSDQMGDLMEKEDSTHTQFGIFAQETLRPTEKTLVDLSLRFDRSDLNIDKNEMTTYDYSTGRYTTGEGVTETDKGFNLLSIRIGGSYSITPSDNLYASLAQSDQVPSNSEVESNTGLSNSTNRSFEIGAKGRRSNLSYDAAVYYGLTTDEIVSVSENDETVYRNAGEVEKVGFEFAGSYDLTDQFNIGANYAFTRIKYLEFNEPVSGVNYSRDGNYMPYVPKHQYSLSLNYDSGWGLKGGLRTETWSSYFLDNANSEEYDGFKFITNANVSYDFNEETALSLNVENLFDKHYAVDAKKSTTGTKYFSAGQPRTFVLSYRHKF